MTRKLNNQRVYKVIKTVVIIVSLVFLFFGTKDLLRANKAKNGDGFDYQGAKEVGYTDKEVNDFISSKIENLKYTATVKYVSGIGILTVFFGGGMLINYIAPKVKTVKKNK